MPEKLMRLAGGGDHHPEPPADPLRFQQAVAAFRARVPMSDEAFQELLEASHAQAFVIAGVAKLDLVDAVWKALDSAVADGTTFDTFKKQIGQQLEAEWGRQNPARLETIFRTNVQRSYGAGTVEMLREPAVLKRRPFWKYSAVLDGRTSSTCSACAGTVLAADDPFWATHQPPLHFNCRSRLIALTAAQAESTGVAETAPDAPPLKGFGNVEADWKPDLTKYPAPLVHEYQHKVAQR